MITFQIQNIEELLRWVKTCPPNFKCSITSMQGGFVHAKFYISEYEILDEKEKENEK